MKKILTLLIADDIKISRLVYTLEKLDIDANDYLTHKPTIVFELIGIKHTLQNEDLFNQFYQKIQQASDNDQTEDMQAIEDIIEWLSSFSKVRID